jgi:cytoskeletal protein CcmA (bactofilin family)
MKTNKQKINMNPTTNIRLQKGFTLVTVLILSSLASILVLTSLKDNITQERLSGNYQKKINARLASERGVFESINAARNAIEENDQASLAELLAVMSVIGGESDSDITFLKGAKFDVTASNPTGSEILLSSTGNRFEGQKTLKARFQFTPAGGYSPFEDAVIGCDGVSGKGSGKVFSYDSSDSSTFSEIDGNFHSVIGRGKKANVSTINENADVILNGTSPVYGNISSTGSITLRGSPTVYGALHANNDISVKQSTIKGSVLTRGSFQQIGGTIRGHVRVNGGKDNNGDYIGVTPRDYQGRIETGVNKKKFTVDMTGTIQNLEQDESSNTELTGKEILYNGETNNPLYDNSDYKKNPNVAKVKQHNPSGDQTDATTNCDHLIIEDKINLVANSATNLPVFEEANGNPTFKFESTRISKQRIVGDIAIYDTYVKNGITAYPSVIESVLGTETGVIKLDSFKITGNINIIIDGNVTLYVESGFTLGGSSTITILKDSSLTIMTKGWIDLGAGGDIIALKHGLTTNGLPAMSIYSSYNGSEIPRNGRNITTDTGIYISGSFDIYAQIYAPHTIVDIGGSGKLYGAVRSKKVKISGSGEILYDAALSKSNRGGSSSTSSTLEFIGMTY